MQSFGLEPTNQLTIHITVLSNHWDGSDLDTNSSDCLSIRHEPFKLENSNNMTHLELVNASISESECLLIAKNSNLKFLNLACNPIGGLGLKNLLSTNLFFLETLILFNCGLKNISKVFDFTRMPKLNHLNLSYN